MRYDLKSKYLETTWNRAVSRRIWILLFFSCQVCLPIDFPFQLILFIWRPRPSQYGEIHLSVPPPNSIPTRGTLTVETGKTSLYSLVLFLFYTLLFGFEMLENVFVLISNSYSLLCYCIMLAIIVYGIWMREWLSRE